MKEVQHNKQKKLAPSLLAANFSCLEKDIRLVEESGSQYLHIDVMDGLFVPNISIGIPVIESIRAISKMVFDVHLMIVQPERYVEAFAQSGADIINIHTEACEDVLACIRKIKALGKTPAVTIKPKTPVETVYPYLDELSMVLLMSVEPGFGGQKFIEASLDKANQLAEYVAKKNLQLDIEMDGGLYLQNIQRALDVGVTVAVVGSGIFKAPDISKAASGFLDILRQ